MVELIACPQCRRQLQVPALYIGQTVQCPECQHRFIAVSSSITAQPLPTPAEPVSGNSKRDCYDDDEDDDFGDIRQPRHRRPDWETHHRGGIILALGLIALVGGMLFCLLPTILGPIAWMLASWDLRAMRDGHMDPSGEGMTHTGQVCGIVATVFLILGGPCVCLAFLGRI